MTLYRFQQAINAFFLVENTPALRQSLPAPLAPLEARPGHAVLAITAFDFVASDVGAYGELVISVLVPPFALPDAELPLAATYPLGLATTTPASRGHAAEQWYLPEYTRCLDMHFERVGHTHSVRVSDGACPVFELRVGRTRARPTSRLYQCFSTHNLQLHRVDFRLEGWLDEHEEELGGLTLHPHPFVALVADILTDDTPLREQSMHDGVQHFGTLCQHGGLA